VGVSHIYSRVAVTEVGYVFVQEWGFHIYIAVGLNEKSSLIDNVLDYTEKVVL
jgi:hypothetical protein